MSDARVMESKYDGTCGECESAVEVGEWISYGSFPNGRKGIVACSSCDDTLKAKTKAASTAVSITEPFRVRVTKVNWSNPENTFAILTVEALGGMPKGSPSVKATFGLKANGAFKVGDTIDVMGQWIEDARFGWQIKASIATPAVDASHQGLVAFLEQLPGIGRARAEAIVRAFGIEGTFEVLDKAPQKLATIPGITPKMASEIAEKYSEMAAFRAVYTGLASYGVEPSLIAKALEEWQADALDVIEGDPYALMELRGVGFKTADTVAIRMGIDLRDARRAAAAVSYVLDEAASEGHVYTPMAMLNGQGDSFDRAIVAVRECGLTPAMVEKGLQTLTAERKRLGRNGKVFTLPPAVTVQGDRVYAAPVEFAEREIARHLARLYCSEVDVVAVPDGPIGNLDDSQAAAVRMIAGAGVVVLTGGPGTGKTTTLKTALDLLEGDGLSVIQCAPTGKAAIRMREQTGRHSSTIHRLLEINPETKGFKRGESNPINCNVLVVDESSMVDTMLMASLLSAVASGSRAIIVGDVDQLPSIGPGRVLADMIQSGAIPTARLTKIHRQASESRIPWVAKDINEGRAPDLSVQGAGVAFMEIEDEATLQGTIVRAVMTDLPAHMGYKPNEIQVLAPQRKGLVGVEELNRVLQGSLNPQPVGTRGVFIGAGGMAFQKDRVIQTRNDYDLQVMNGEIGAVTEMNIEGGVGETADTKIVLVVDFGDRKVEYTKEAAKDLHLAYAITVHKAQGSQFPAVVLPISSSHKFMLTRSLVYTAITRAEKQVLLLGEMNQMARSTRNTRGTERRTSLRERVPREVEATIKTPMVEREEMN